MRGYNKAVIMGNVTKEPELRYTVNKRAFVRFTVAVSRKWRDAGGEIKESVDFIPVVAWGPMAENCGKYLKKGSGVFVEGRIQTGSYDAKDGSGKRYTTDILASEVHFMGGKREEDGHERGAQPAQSYSPPATNAKSAGKSVRDTGFSDNDDFPTDISEMDLDEGEEAEIPF